MNRQEFIRKLNHLLSDIPDSDRMDAIKYYNDYFDEAGYENEAKVILELGSPQKVAENIKADLNASTYEKVRDYEESSGYQNQTETKNNKGINVLIIVLLILSSPVWIGVVAGLFGAVIGVIVGLFGSGVGMFAASIPLILTGISQMSVVPLEGVTMLGVGMLLLSLSVLIVLLLVLLVGNWIPKLVKVCIKGCKSLFHSQEGGDEI